jgi:hypothetical protein
MGRGYSVCICIPETLEEIGEGPIGVGKRIYTNV